MTDSPPDATDEAPTDRAMTVQALAEQLQALRPDDHVKITVAERGIGQTPAIDLESVRNGIDWDNDAVLLEPATAVRPETSFADAVDERTIRRACSKLDLMIKQLLNKHDPDEHRLGKMKDAVEAINQALPDE